MNILRNSLYRATDEAKEINAVTLFTLHYFMMDFGKKIKFYVIIYFVTKITSGFSS